MITDLILLAFTEFALDNVIGFNYSPEIISFRHGPFTYVFNGSYKRHFYRDYNMPDGSIDIGCFVLMNGDFTVDCYYMNELHYQEADSNIYLLDGEAEFGR